MTSAAAAYAKALAEQPKPNKYRNKPIVIDGVRFASQREGRRYSELYLMWKAGLITDLRLQPSYLLEVNGQPIAAYVADFKYIRDGVEVVEDAKGVRTDVFRIKKALMKACLNINVVEV